MIAMATTERPPSRIDGKPNPAYTKWYREQQKQSVDAELAAESQSRDEQDAQEVAATAAEVADQDFQSAAEPEQTNNDDPREPEVAPALENPLPVEVDSEAGSSPAPADGETITITVDRIARNKSFVYGALNGELVPIRVKKNTGPKLVGKPIHVLVTHEAGHTIYTHAP